MQDWDMVIHNVHLATMEHGYGELLDAAIAVKDGRIAWFGPGDELPASGAVLHDGQGCWLTPGLIDCHTHIVHAGNRSDEFEARLNGASYEDISRAGGGIMSTVRATRAASDDELLRQSLPRVLALLAEGMTTLEIKSGYGLDADSEAKMLRVARRIGQELPVTVRTTFLGAHALPPEYAGQADAYIELLCAQMLPRLAGDGLVDAVDAFCERIGFTLAQTETVFEAAQALGLPVKLHAEQLSDLGGAALVARYGGLSADHLEFLSDEGIAAMARHGTVAVLLPGAYYFLREVQQPPISDLRAAGVPMAVSTDCNPGTSPMTSLLLAMNMACTLWRLTPQEALAGVTCHAARALGLQQETGSLAVGKRADFALWRIARPADLAYALGLNPCAGVVHGGVWRAPVVSLPD
ncbi:imidazolonepropionase [Janthinobacterium sp. HH103]|uniref:imidazolonepropionase n=1 Tax=unclassified Janthinobacterium TaxID=2610881 RepID=UPI00087529DE|nr:MULTISPECIES: imidazolonepropionase [unclassified Janthinobacterium]OEZ68028.1 imidazolonepropionase [Janthinobacterium sp. HH100]OEZ68470.1 imidazolonepropionase [Janthinobacterium sp. HH103]QOU75833.1 Imidazolonepropionase [Janthinobacterium sp. HH102]